MKPSRQRFSANNIIILAWILYFSTLIFLIFKSYLLLFGSSNMQIEVNFVASIHFCNSFREVQFLYFKLNVMSMLEHSLNL